MGVKAKGFGLRSSGIQVSMAYDVLGFGATDIVFKNSRIQVWLVVLKAWRLGVLVLVFVQCYSGRRHGVPSRRAYMHRVSIA